MVCCVLLLLSHHSIGGLILDKTISDPNYEGMAVFTPVMNGECAGSRLLHPSGVNLISVTSEGQHGFCCKVLLYKQTK